MSRYDITHTCGHTIAYGLGGRVRDRDWRAQRLAERECDECYRHWLVTRSKMLGDDARWELETAGVSLPDLVGTPKQIAWARDLRARAIVALRGGLLTTERFWRLERIFYGVGASSPTLVSEVKDLLCEAAGSQTSAHWWCDRSRGMEGMTLVRVAAWLAACHPQLRSRFARAVGISLGEHIERIDSEHPLMAKLTIAEVGGVLTHWRDAAAERDRARDAAQWRSAIGFWREAHAEACRFIVDDELAERLAAPEVAA